MALSGICGIMEMKTEKKEEEKKAGGSGRHPAERLWRIKRTVVFAAIFLLLSVLLCGFTPVLTGMYDQADLFTAEEEQKLLREAEQVAEQTQTQVVFLTYEDAGGKTTEQYTDDFCDANIFGYENTDDGAFIALVIDLDNREIFVKTGGSAIRRVSDREIEQILDRIFARMPEEGGRYYEPALAFVSAASDALQSVEGSGAEEQNPAVNVALRLVLSMAIGAVVVGVMLFGRKTGTKASAAVYLQTTPRVVRQSDRFINTTVTKTRINTESSSSSHGGGSSHTSSGGRSYGGGGRKF